MPASPAAKQTGPASSACYRLPAERQMFCTDIQVIVGKPEQAFLQAYNQLVHQRLRYMASLKRVEEQSEDLLLQYRASELRQLLSGGETLCQFDYALSLKLLDHMEVTPEGKLTVLFLAGVRLTV